MVKQIVILLVLMGVAGAFGYYFAPGKVETKTVEIVKEVEKIKFQENKHINTRIVETIWPDGRTTKETFIVDNSVIFLDRETEIEKIKESLKIITTEKPMNKVSVSTNIVGKDRIADVYQVNYERRIMGPVFLGVYGRTDKEFGAGVGIEF